MMVAALPQAGPGGPPQLSVAAYQTVENTLSCSGPCSSSQQERQAVEATAG